MSTWAIRPMEEEGVGALSESDGMWHELFNATWDGRVKISGLTFNLAAFEGEAGFGNGEGTKESDGSRRGGAIASMGVRFGPASLPTITGPGPGYGQISQLINFKAFDSIDLEDPNKRTRRRFPSPYTLSDDNVNMIMEWIGDCKQHHDECATPASDWIPTRLLAIDGFDDRTVVRLVECSSIRNGDSNTPYAALSHMWGSIGVSPPLRTLQSNYSVITGGVDVEDLPRNFADSVFVCQKLNIPYLWIDSLCIVQDDKADWQKEAALMHLVYRNAEVTIAATSATSSHDGFLARDLEMVPAYKIKYHVGGRQNEQSDSKADTLILCPPTDDVESGVRRGDVDSSEWNNRGWTMQERSLSTRIVHFCKNKIYFECRTCLKSEEGEPEKHQVFQSFRMWPRATRSAPTDNRDGSTTAESLYDRWRSAVGRYSARNLTQGSDKLPAIQSVAAEMSGALSDEYIPFAGMWKNDLHIELVWYVEAGIAKRPAQYRAPTWSWASVDAKVGFTRGTRTIEAPAPLKDCFKIQSIGQAVLGSGQSADNYLKMSSWVRSVSKIAYIDDDDDYWRYIDRGTFPYDVFTEVDDASGRTKGLLFAHGLLDMGGRNVPPPTKGPFLYAHVNNEQHPSGILLQQMEATGTRGSPVVWSRIGVATVFHKSGDAIAESLFQEITEPESLVIN